MNLAQVRDRKIIAGVLALLVGTIGIHKFVLGNTKAGLIMLLLCVTVIAIPLMGLIGFVEGIIYLTRSDEEFLETYIEGRKDWF